MKLLATKTLASEQSAMRTLIPFLPLLYLLLLLQVDAHRCVLRDTPNQPPITLPDSRINDDYCDCLDGSDEFRTSACPNGTFICANVAYRKRSIPASWVRDGSCDCCDGSDEPPGRCSDNCAALREREWKKAKQRADTIMRGVATRQKYVKCVSGAIEKDARELRKLERQLAAIERALNKSKIRADGLRKLRDWQHRPPAAKPSNPVSSASREEPNTAGQHFDDDDDDDYHYNERFEDDDIMEDEKVEEPNAKESDSHSQKGDGSDDIHVEDKQEDRSDEDFEDDAENEEAEADPQGDEDKDEDEDDPEDDDESNNDDNDDDTEITTGGETEIEHQVKQEDNTGASSDGDSQTSASAFESEKEPEVVPEPGLNVDEICADLETSNANYVFRIVSYARMVLLAKLHRILPKMFPVRHGSAISGLDECIRKADSAKWKFESQKTDVEEKMKMLKKKQTTDYGNDKALRKLHGECTKTKVLQYEFEHCVFDLVRQYEHGSAIATLGRFDGWEVDGDKRYLKYSNGDTCWNGPARSIKVQLLCGEKEHIASVDEPNRCTYFMKFWTPAVCEKAMADKVMSEFDTDSEQKEEL